MQQKADSMTGLQNWRVQRAGSRVLARILQGLLGTYLDSLQTLILMTPDSNRPFRPQQSSEPAPWDRSVKSRRVQLIPRPQQMANYMQRQCRSARLVERRSYCTSQVAARWGGILLTCIDPTVECWSGPRSCGVQRPECARLGVVHKYGHTAITARQGLLPTSPRIMCSIPEPV